MPKLIEWENSLKLMSDKDLEDIASSLDTLSHWGMWGLNYPEMRIIRKIVEFEGKQRVTAHLACKHEDWSMIRKPVGPDGQMCFVTFKRCNHCSAIAPIGTDKWKIWEES